MDLTGKVVLITGASAGIGEATAIEAGRAGANLIITARRVDKLADLAERLRKEFPTIKVWPVQLDVSDYNQVDRTFKELPQEASKIDVLVNNAGLALGLEHISDVPREKIDVMFDTNVKGLVYVTQHVLKYMKTVNRGHIINISSISGHEIYTGGGIYCATKHAVDAITRTLRMELTSTNINVCAIEPGLVNTEFSTVRLGSAEKAGGVYKGFEPLYGKDIAETVVFVASRRQNVQIAQMLVLPTAQSSITHIHKNP